MMKNSAGMEIGAMKLDERALQCVSGADGVFPNSWKANSFDGKGNDAMTEDIVFVSEMPRRI